MKRFAGATVRVALLTALFVFGAVQIVGAAESGSSTTAPVMTPQIQARIDALARKADLPRQREAAAARRRLLLSASRMVSGGSTATVGAAALSGLPAPGGQPDYFGLTPNWAFTPPLRKFVDTLPGFGAANANNLGNYIPVAKPDTVTYPGSDYYVIELRQFTQQLHSDLPPTTLRGYVQVNNGTDAAGHNTLVPDPIHYLGPFIMANRDRPVRIKFTNKLPTGAGGDLFLPVDKTVMGAGTGPDGVTEYTENRAGIHLHGGRTVWISDGNPHQWVTPAGEDTPYPKGVSVKNVPDMPDPGAGSMTLIYSNQQSARLLWFHDHTYGMTRLNVYAGEAGAYMLTDETEQRLIKQGVIPADQIPLIIQDKTFVDADTILTTDPTWNWGSTAPVPHTGDLWFPHVYMPNQNPYDLSGSNAKGRWDYGLWFWPATTDISHGTVANPYYDPLNAPWEPPEMPGVPAVSSVMEAFNDTPLVNGVAYPTVTVQPKSYRFRILNGASDRTFNLQLYQADPTVWTADGRSFTEVKMVPAVPTAGFPALWPTDGRPGGVPDPKTVGPDFIQIGTEGGFLPAPTIVKNQPIDKNLNMKAFTFGNVTSKALCVAPAERADVIIDFSRYAGRTLILYNDAPAAFPANDPRNDYFTDSPDNRDTGGAAPTEVGFGPNTRTIMQIKVVGKPAPTFDMAKLRAAFASTATTPGVFAASQDPIIVGQSGYDSAYATSFPKTWPYAGYSAINDTSMSFATLAGTTETISFMGKGLHDEMGGSYDDYGRMASKLGLSVPGGNALTQGFIPQGYIDPPTENLVDSMVPMSPVAGDGTQIWKLTHNGVDTHPLHFHLFDVQLINRVGWDNAIDFPDPNELGWKETVRVNPLQDTIVALRPVAPRQPFGVPESVRPLDPTQPLGAAMGFSNRDILTGNPLVPPQLNIVVNFGWEYMWHCHILSHEEMEMMRPVTFEVSTTVPPAPIIAAKGQPGSAVDLVWIDATPAGDAAALGSPRGEIGFRIERSTVNAAGTELVPYTEVGTALANATTFEDTATVAGTVYRYRVFAYNASGEVGSDPTTVAPDGALGFYTVSPWASTRGTIAPAGPRSVADGADSPAFTITPDPHARLIGVFVDGVSIGATGSVTLSNVRSDQAIWALFGPDLFPVSVTADPNGSVVPAGTSVVGLTGFSVAGARVMTAVAADEHLVPWGESETFTIMPKLGYRIVDVQADGVSVGAVSSYTFTGVKEPHTLSATFAPVSFTVRPGVVGHGSISPRTARTVDYGGGVTFAITPSTGYRVSDVVVNGVSVGSVRSFAFTNVTGDSTITAKFAPRIATTLSITPDRSRLSAHTSVVLIGYLRPASARARRVSLQIKRPGRTTWVTVWSGNVSSTGRYRVSYRPSVKGTNHFRVVFGGTSDYVSSHSRTVDVYVH